MEKEIVANASSAIMVAAWLTVLTISCPAAIILFLGDSRWYKRLCMSTFLIFTIYLITTLYSLKNIT